MVLIELWEKDLIGQGKSKNTIDSYIRDINKFIKWFEETYGREFDGKLLEIDIRYYQSYLLNTKKQNINTITRNMVALNRFNQFLISIGKSKNIDNFNKFIIKKADEFDKTIKILENKDLHKLRRSFYKVDNKRDTAIFETLINTGVRVTELVSLELDDINITDRNGVNNYSFIKIRQGKGKIYREIPLNNIARNAIKAYLLNRSTNISNKVFLGERGPLQRSAINKILKKYCDIAQIEIISPHILRHTFATKLLTESDIDLVTISRLLGHSNSQVTERYYINTTTKDKIKAVESLNF